MQRVQFEDEPGVDGGLYFASQSARPYFSTGCYMLDLEMGGGFSEGQAINLVGASSSGKSIVVIEAAAAFLAKFKKSIARIHDAENAYDKGYLKSIGIPVDQIEFTSRDEKDENYVANTVEAIQKDVYKQIARSKKKKLHIFYAVDSWDSLTDEQEYDKDMSDSASYSSKAKAGSEFGRRLWHDLPEANLTLLLVSQVRDNIGVTYGPKHKRSGGNWLEFYCSQVVWLYLDSTKMESTRGGVKRKYGAWVRAVSKKNRRTGECEPVYIPIVKGYGVDDLMACVRFLIEVGKTDAQFDSKTMAVKYMNSCWKFDESKYRQELAEVKKSIRPIWDQIVSDFAPRRQRQR